MAERKVYKCECGYVTHFAKALEAHCKFRHHKPMEEKAEDKPLMTVKKPAEVIPAEEPKAEDPAPVVKKTRKPRKKKAESEE
jgi:hypothetical protein